MSPTFSLRQIESRLYERSENPDLRKFEGDDRHRGCKERENYLETLAARGHRCHAIAD